MNKFIILVVLVCLGLVSARSSGSYEPSGNDNYPGEHGREGGGNYRGGYGGSGGYEGHGGSHGGNGNTFSSVICVNSTLAQSFVTQTEAIITQLTNNGSFTDFLQKAAHEMAYFQSVTNTALLLSNCTAYFTGLTAARALDTTAQNQLEQYAKIAVGLFENVLRNLVGHVKDDYHEH